MTSLTTLELFSRIPGGENAFGSGFPVRYAGKTWLITCQHNIEDASIDLTGRCECASILIRRPFVMDIDLTDGRTVVSASVSGVIADCAAIELRPSELPPDVQIYSPHDIVSPPLDNEPPSLLLQLRINGQIIPYKPPARVLILSGFSNGLTGFNPCGHVAAGEYEALPLPQPFMLSFQPVGKNGFSGGPIVEWLRTAAARVVGIYTHSFNATMTVGGDGFSYDATVEAGAGVPIRIILDAIDGCALGSHSIVSVEA
jgi:hypothetical protein